MFTDHMQSISQRASPLYRNESSLPTQVARDNNKAVPRMIQ